MVVGPYVFDVGTAVNRVATSILGNSVIDIGVGVAVRLNRLLDGARESSSGA